MEIYFYQAECGDAARINYVGNDGVPHNIFIDSGYERTFRHILLDQIQKIEDADEKIDLWIISHIHDDHIGGVIKYIKSIKIGEINDIVNSWYYNPPRKLTNKFKINQSLISLPESIDQGDDLSNYLYLNNKMFDYDFTNDLKEQNLFGLKIILLSPSKNKLKRLKDKYEISKFIPIEKSEYDSISEAVKTKNYDYHIKLEDFNLDIWKEDSSIENGSSISILTEFNNKRILWLSDCHPTDIVNKLKELGYSKDNQLECDWVKVTHHGSKGNNSNNLYDLIRCKNYLMSVNGENIYYLPTKESMARIIRNKNRPKELKYNFYFTYDNVILRKIFEVDGSDVFSKYNFEVNYLNNEKFWKFNI